MMLKAVGESTATSGTPKGKNLGYDQSSSNRLEKDEVVKDGVHDPLLLVLHRVGVIRVDGRSIRIHSHLRIWYCLCAVLYLAWVC